MVSAFHSLRLTTHSQNSQRIYFRRHYLSTLTKVQKHKCLGYGHLLLFPLITRSQNFSLYFQNEICDNTVTAVL